MSSQTIERLGVMLDRHISRYGMPRVSHMCTFGGEPLLVEETTKFLISVVSKKIPNIVIGLNTNGDLLTPKFLQWFKNKGELQYGIGDFSIEEIERVCKMVVSNRAFLMPTYVLTPYNLDRILEVVPLIRKYTPYIVFRHLISKHPKEYLKKYKEGLVNIFDWMLSTDNLFNPTFLWEVSLLSEGNYHALCGTRYVIIDPDGSVGTCCARDEKIGSIWDDNFDFYQTIEDYNPPKHHFKGIPECEACEFRNVCGGGCPYLKILNGKDWNSPSPLCEANKEIIPLLLKVKERWNG